ncbi:nicotinamide-nucleotide amidase/nicotinamide-nucleotide amidase [Dehalogenimonas formicexedens]|uniref:Nicotinamide-nucleotide amidase/nicotinamide-nucleotide amidase n=1 Tax=Dehalogenimonas formicexedens TaxID=1839801 RepID=A0A1P8F620_9CHLR|nr:CinA family protein [Dehalogenimonas formicexedens]APV43921.1 nicotinamide-nucleotide amidase/nicotinamide-nucleotide amidase [Dehalogenimonas formicexedens]
MTSLENQLAKLLQDHGLIIGTVESATGGMIAERLTSVSGASKYFKGGLVTYHNELKIRLCGVRYETLLAYGAVSPQVAEEMAAGGRKALGVDICLSDSGIAGPGGESAGKPVGLFYIGLATPEGVWSRKFIFKGNRGENRGQAVAAALKWAVEHLANG